MKVTELISQLITLNKEYGDLDVCEIEWGDTDIQGKYLDINVYSVKPCVVSHPIDVGYIVVFD